MNTMREYALGYAAGGWEIIPLDGKAPRVRGGFHTATTDLEQVETWWKRWPDANIGLRPAPGVIVIDVDPRNGGDFDTLGDIPDTLTACTGGGGFHVWFTFRGVTAHQLAGADGIDIKHREGFLVAPPSLHESGRRYEWLNLSPVAPLPVHLAPRVRKPRPPHRPRTRVGATSVAKWDGIIRFLGDSPQGARNDRLYWAFCRAAERDAHQDVWDAIADTARNLGLGEPEIRATAKSALKGGAVDA